MKTGIECFAGANTSEGFFSGFDGIFSCVRQTFFIKGAPGTGKSSLMKRMRARQLSMGHTVSAFYCSSDPDRLDGIIDETLSCAIIDATAPHAYDPPLPGAAGAILSLGDYLNERALRSETNEITRINGEMKTAFHMACSYLKSAKAIWSANKTDESVHAADALSSEIVSPLLRLNGLGSLKTYFLEACTHKGVVRFTGQFPRDITVSIPAPFPACAHLLLSEIARKARIKGLCALVFPSPVDPACIKHVYLPDVPLFITTSETDGAQKVYDDFAGSAVYNPGDKALFDALVEKACAAMAKAKSLHDELEAVYTPRMDFSKLVECESRLICAFDEMVPV